MEVKKKEIENGNNNTNNKDIIRLAELNLESQSILVSLYNLRVQIKNIENNVKDYEKETTKIIKNLIKNSIPKKDKKKPKSKGNRKLCGFAAKTNVNKELISFLNEEKVKKCIKIIKDEISESNNSKSSFQDLDDNNMISRTSVTKIINKYIKINDLQNKNNRIYIIPDELLSTILLPLDKKDEDNGGYKYFNLQKYTKHLYC